MYGNVIGGIQVFVRAHFWPFYTHLPIVRANDRSHEPLDSCLIIEGPNIMLFE